MGKDDDGNNDDDDGNHNKDNDKDNNNDDSSDKGNEDKLAVTSKAEDNESGSDQGVGRSRRRGKGVTQKYADYSLLMAAR